MTRPLRLRLPPHPDLRPMKDLSDDSEGSSDVPGDSVGKDEPPKNDQNYQQSEQERPVQVAPQQLEHEQQEKRRQQLLEPSLQGAPDTGPATTVSSPRRPRAAQRIAGMLIAVVKQGANTLLRKSPLNSPRRAVRLGVTAEPASSGHEVPAQCFAGGTGVSPRPVLTTGEAAEFNPANGSVSSSAGVLAEISVKTPLNGRAENYPTTVPPEENVQRNTPRSGQLDASMTPCASLGIGDSKRREAAEEETTKLLTVTACRQKAEGSPGTEEKCVRSQVMKGSAFR